VDRPRIEKAYLQLMTPTVGSTPPPTGGGGGLGSVQFPFNPKEFTLKKDANWKSEPAKGSTEAPTPEFTGTGPGKVTLEVFLDGTGDPGGTITAEIDTLLSTVKPLAQTVDQNKPSPPMVMFGWGSQVILTGFVKNVSIKYTMFKPDGTPLRAVAKVTLEEIPQTPGRQNPTSGGLAARRTHRLIEGDSLASVAHREYGRPGLWRAIAEANDIDDPLHLTPGRNLLIPPVEDVLPHRSV